MFLEDDSDWKRAFFARLIAVLGLPLLIFTLSGLRVPDDRAKFRLVLLASASSLVFFLTSIAISHVPYLRRREIRSMWHFGPIELGIMVMICALLMYLLLASCLMLLHQSTLR